MIIIIENMLITQFDISFVDISSYVGLAAAGAMTINLALGLLISMQYSPARSWPHRRLPIASWHEWIGYSALFLALLHPAILLLTSVVKFTIWDILLPINAPLQPIIFTIGAIAVYSLIFVSITAYFRSRFKYDFWKKIHYASYVVIISFTIHGVLANPSLKEEMPINWLDAGKIFVELCALLCTGLIIWRVTQGREVRRKVLQAQEQATSKAWRGFLKIEAVFDIGSDVKTFRLVSPNGKMLPFHFKPGQYLSFRLNVNEKTFIRNYSISSSPTEMRYCDVTIKRIDDGIGSTFFHAHLLTSSLVECTGVYGEFVFTGKEANRVLLIGGGIGVTPLISMLKNLAATQWQHEVYLLFAVRTPDHILFHEELLKLKDILPRFNYLILPSSIKENEWVGSSGRINADLLKQFVPDVASCNAYLCGPEGMMDATINLLGSLGMPRKQIFTELFVSTKNSEYDELATEAKIVFSKSHKEFMLPAGSTLLEAAEAVSVAVESACRVGTCGTCKVKVLSGSTAMVRDDCLSDNEIKSGIVLACQAVAQSANIVIDY